MLENLLSVALALEDEFLTDDLSEVEQAKGRRYIAGLLRWELQRALTASDVNYPCFLPTKDHISKWGWENPDNLQRSVGISPDLQYVISGTRGTTADLVIEVLTLIPGDTDAHMRGEQVAVSVLDDHTLVIEDDGSYTVVVGGERPADARNHLPSSPNGGEVFVRHVFGADDEEAGTISIRPVNPPTEPPVDIDSLLDLAARRLASVARVFDEQARTWGPQFLINAAQPPVRNTTNIGGLPGQCNTFGRFMLEPGEGLVISMDPVKCRYSSLSIGDERWFHSMDYRNTHCSSNSARAHQSSDGRYHYVIANEDPGVPNWYDANGNASGLMMFRWTGLPAGEPAPALPDIRLASLSEIGNLLPSDDPVVTPRERQQAIAKYREVLDRRFFGR